MAPQPGSEAIPTAVPRQQTPTPLSYLFELTDDLICAASPDGYFKRCNPAFQRVLGWPTEILLTTPFVELVHPEDRGPTLAQLDRLGRGETVIDFTNRYRTKDGDYVWLRWRAYTDPGSGGTIFATGQVLQAGPQASDSGPDLETTITRVLRHHEHTRSRSEAQRETQHTQDLQTEGHRADVAEKKAKAWATWLGAIVTAVSVAGGGVAWAVAQVKESKEEAVQRAVEAEQRRTAAEAAQTASETRFGKIESEQQVQGDQIERLGELYIGQQVQVADGFDYMIEAVQVMDPKVKRKVGEVPASITEGKKAADEIRDKRKLEELFSDNPDKPLDKPKPAAPSP